MFERFNEKARDIVVKAQDEAKKLKHNYVGTEHIFLGLVVDSNDFVAQILFDTNLGYEQVRDGVIRIVGEGETTPKGQIPFTPRAKKVIDLALREALSHGDNYIGPEHLLLGLIREGDGVAMKFVNDSGADPEAIRNQVISHLQTQRPSNVARAPTIAELAGEIILTIKAERSEGDPPLELYRAELIGPQGTWPRRFGSIEALEEFLTGLNATFGILGIPTHFCWGRPGEQSEGGRRQTVSAEAGWKSEYLDKDGNVINI